MYKYIRYIGIVLFTMVRKVLGLVWYFVAVPFRGYARNVIYNYVLQNDIYLKRLLERPIEEVVDGWVINPYHNTEGGYILERDITWLEYQLVYWFIWGWLDDDSNQDTYAEGYNTTLINRERIKWLPRFIINALKKTNADATVFGNSFDLGDRRSDYPAFSFWASYLWTIRNTAYNFKYMQWEEDRPEMLFYKEVGSYRFGYLPDGRNKGRLVFGGF